MNDRILRSLEGYATPASAKASAILRQRLDVDISFLNNSPRIQILEAEMLFLTTEITNSGSNSS
jgi:hypothetical protein